MARTLKFSIFRYNPQDPESIPHMESFALEETDAMTLFIALNRIREEQDPGLQFDFCCRSGICGSCGMVINGRPGLACHTKTRDLPDEITLLPLPVFQLVGDLSVDTGSWFRELYDTVESWIHTKKDFDPDAPEERMENHVAEAIYELDRCVECDRMLSPLRLCAPQAECLGAAGLNRWPFLIDRRRAHEKDYYELLASTWALRCMACSPARLVAPSAAMQTRWAFCAARWASAPSKAFSGSSKERT